MFKLVTSCRIAMKHLSPLLGILLLQFHCYYHTIPTVGEVLFKTSRDLCGSKADYPTRVNKNCERQTGREMWESNDLN